ncbi:FHA domain-containing protein [Brevibacterium jeotgali]|uniref:FHA domain-containing protein n=1 Tax=Brevibacterium jeotgali TaxID=1262550 RepID=A0A2H1L728_9MICO|nr:type III secretion system (T3SS) inner membrane Yop/YscD-like protein [Brevibacterium jeotgali]SMY12540.1 FHA domain-containing protein [Brevibacterium jeotgali]
MSQQNGGFPDGQQPWQGQESTSATPHVFPFGNQQQGAPEEAPQEPQYDAQQQPQGSQPIPQQHSPQGWAQPAAPQQYDQGPYGQQQYDQQQYDQGQQGSQPQAWGHAQVDQQWAQQQPGQFGSGPQHQNAEAQPGHAFGSQGHTQGGPPQEWNGPQAGQPPAAGQEQGSQGNPQFSGILDPHTGEIHPVPDLQNLDETDALLVVVSGPDAGAQILLDTDVVTVGRSPNADIFLDDVTVSRKHAEFVRTPSGFTLRDNGSLNGTYVGRQLIDSIELQNGADVQIGKFRMIFQQRPRTS